MGALPIVSFEFFPPKNDAAKDQLWGAIRALEGLKPRFVSVTYGAGGSTREATFATVRDLSQGTTLAAAAHLTCVGHTRAEITDLAQQYWQSGIRHIVALRGDVPAGNPRTGDLSYAHELVAHLKSVADFEISVAAYPEMHPEALSPRADIENLKRKLGAGATRAITQYFFDTRRYMDFLNQAQKSGIKEPIVPGILPVSNFAQVLKFSALCGTSVPKWMKDLFEGLDDHPDTRKLIAAMVATEQCRELMAQGIREFHFYTLNRADLTLGICRRMGLKLSETPGLRSGLAGQAVPPSHDPAI